MNHLKVQEKKKKLEQEAEKNRMKIDEKIKEKHSRSDKRNSTNKKMFEERERRIKNILLKKYNDIKEHELQALSPADFRKEDYEFRKEDMKNISFLVEPSFRKVFAVIFK